MPRMTFIEPGGARRVVEARVGDSLLDVAHRHEIDIEGACEGCMACATCHVIVEPAFFDKLELPSEEEEEMLDLAVGVTETSRLGCQIFMTEALDGLVVRLPVQVNNLLDI